MITIKSDREIALMREAGNIAMLAHEEIRKAIKPGVSTKELDKIRNKVNFENLALAQQKKIIQELFKMLHCNSVNANLSEFGLGDRIGRLSGYNITDGIIISKSVTGIRESKYEF